MLSKKLGLEKSWMLLRQTQGPKLSFSAVLGMMISPHRTPDSHTEHIPHYIIQTEGLLIQFQGKL